MTTRARRQTAEQLARARSRAAKQGWVTRRRNARTRAMQEGQRKREATESRLTPAQKRARTIEARKFEAAQRASRRSNAARKGWETRRSRGQIAEDVPRGVGVRVRVFDDLGSLDDYLADYDGDYDVYDMDAGLDSDYGLGE